jgi:hypothetical protein
MKVKKDIQHPFNESIVKHPDPKNIPWPIDKYPNLSQLEILYFNLNIITS